MSQTFVDAVRMTSSECFTVMTLADKQQKQLKINLTLDNKHHMSVFQNRDRETVINIRQGTRSVSISKTIMLELCDLKEIITLCCSFVERCHTINI